MSSVVVGTGSGNEREPGMSLQSSIHNNQRHLRLRLQSDDPGYPGLIKLKLSGKELSRLPASMFEMSEVQVLELSPERETCLFYQLSVLPPDICRLSNLRVLILDTNTLSSLPSEMGALVHLERLTISNNRVSFLPESFSQLRSLKSFHAANNRLTTFPQVACSLPALVFLDLSDNQIQGAVPEAIRCLIQLETLLLAYNNITSLPETIGELKNLHTLWLGGNSLRELPPGLGSLDQLDWSNWYCSLCLDGNPLERPPIDVARHGAEEIRKYFVLKGRRSPRRL